MEDLESLGMRLVNYLPRLEPLVEGLESWQNIPSPTDVWRLIVVSPYRLVAVLLHGFFGDSHFMIN